MKSVVLYFLAAAMFGQSSNLPPCRVGMHVPIVSPLNYAATILAIDEANGSYQVKSDRDGLTDWVPARNLRYSCTGAEAKPVSDSFFTGTWTMFLGPTAHNEVIDSKGYVVVGPGARVPPLVIRADGSYTWTLDSKTIVNGKWRTMAANELRSGTKAPAILLLNAEGGKNWQVWRTGVNKGNNRDAIGLERMDLGLSYQGTRLP